METIDLAPLEGLRNLNGLDLSENQLKTVDLRPLRFCNDMYEVNLENNPLKSLVVPKGFECTPLKMNVDHELEMIERDD